MSDNDRGNENETRVQRFGRLMREEREARGWSRETLRAKGGPAEQTQHNTENFKIRRPKAPTFTGYDTAFGWEEDTAAKIFAGAAPPERTTNQSTTHETMRQTIAFRLANYSTPELSQVLDLLKIVDGMRNPKGE